MFNEPTKDILNQLPRYRANENTPPKDVIIHGHFFAAPAFDWYVAEYDGDDTFFGFVNLNDLQNAEWGSFALSELREFRASAPLINAQTKKKIADVAIEIEWDEYWTPKKFSDIKIPGLRGEG